jgi:tetratricopeptide (TPR) repeat protein
MGLRFGKSIRIGKHVRLNISRSGIGFSVGVRGFRISTGPRGTRATASLPGTGLSYVKQLSSPKRASAASEATAATRQAAEVPQISSPGLLAPRHEKSFYSALTALEADDQAEALQHFLAAADTEPSAAIMAATLLEHDDPRIPQLLEPVVTSDHDFPTALMQKYLSDDQTEIDITRFTSATVPIDGMAAVLLLAEAYQAQGRLYDAMGVLEEVEDLSGDPAVTLSLCELYATTGQWDGVIDRAQQIPVDDDVTFEIALIFGIAMHQKDLNEAAIKVFTEALRKKRGRPAAVVQEMMYARALAYEIVGKKAQAKKEFEKIYAENPSFRDVAERVMGQDSATPESAFSDEDPD